ncbi:MAG: PAC2 family protein [Streptosporangiales bacterium]|nr:PAC2 family protein [Streptosporangiales bacterium]
MPHPEDLYRLDPDLPELDRPVLLHSLDGFVDAGSVGSQVREQLFEHLPKRIIVTFDTDPLIDYRSRRPIMTFDRDHWSGYEPLSLVVYVMEDTAGTPFLLLTGPEPDVSWEAFTAAVRSLIERFDVRLTVGVHGIPMGVPHTRPIGLTPHATRVELIEDYKPWLNKVQVPGSASALLELRLGEAGRDAVGFAVHVPHYLSQAEYPTAAVAALEALEGVTGLRLPADDLRTAAEVTDREIREQVEGSEEVAKVVTALEQQYDAYAGAADRENLLADDAEMPTADELGAEFERFLAERERKEP